MSLQWEHDVNVKDKEEVAEPPMYNVVLLNDDYTPMDFVVDLLIKLFGHNDSNAVDIMLNVHENGSGVAGTYGRDIAETRIAQVHSVAQTAGHPLKAIIEPNKT